jgi:hypothetical protein
MPWSEAVLAGNLLDFEDGYSAPSRGKEKQHAESPMAIKEI